MARLFKLVRRDVWREQLHEFEHIAPQHNVFAESDPRCTAREQSFGIYRRQVLLIVAAFSHAGDDTHAEPHANIGFNDVRISCRKHDVGFEALIGKCAF